MLSRMDTQEIERGERFAHLVALELWGAVQARGYTMTRLGQLVGISQPQLSRYFNLHRELPVSVANDLCEAVGIDLVVITERAYDRLMEELGPYNKIDAQIVSLYTPVEGVPMNAAALRTKRGPHAEQGHEGP